MGGCVCIHVVQCCDALCCIRRLGWISWRQNLLKQCVCVCNCLVCVTLGYWAGHPGDGTEPSEAVFQPSRVPQAPEPPTVYPAQQSVTPGTVCCVWGIHTHAHAPTHKLFAVYPTQQTPIVFRVDKHTRSLIHTHTRCVLSVLCDGYSSSQRTEE